MKFENLQLINGDSWYSIAFSKILERAVKTLIGR